MEDLPSTPTKRPHYRLSGLSTFIPLSEEPSTAVSTRGQRLPSLIQSRSTASLFTLPRRPRSERRNSVHSINSDTEVDPLIGDELVLGGGGSHDSASASPHHRKWHHSYQAPQEIDARRMSLGPEILMTPQMRSMRLIGNSNPRYRWQQYYKTEEQLSKMKKPLRKYYERNNFLISQYIYIDRLLDSSLPHNLIQEYTKTQGNGYTNPMNTINEEPQSAISIPGSGTNIAAAGTTPTETTKNSPGISPNETRLKRTPKNLYKLPDEATPLLGDPDLAIDPEEQLYPEVPYDSDDEGVDSDDPVVTAAIYLNLVANVILLVAKLAVIVMTSSLSVLASLVDAALDFLSTAIVWTTTKLISQQDQYSYPVGRRRLEPVGVLVFSVIMITSFFQVFLQCINRLTMSGDHSVVQLTLPAIVIMVSTVVIKGFCWFWCRLVKNSSVQALAQDAVTDVVFNTFSIIFPLIGFYLNVWWLDALGGLLLSLYVIFNWSKTSSQHVRNLCGAAATADQRNVLLYLTMRFAKTIKYIQGLQAYHAGDKLNVEVDIVLDENMSLRDSHDLGESLQYVLESVPTVDRAFVHADYADWNLPSHMNQQG